MGGLNGRLPVPAGYITTMQMASWRRVSLKRLRIERMDEKGPPFIRVGGQVFYSLTGFHEWRAGKNAGRQS